jgi:hypothetical protein
MSLKRIGRWLLEGVALLGTLFVLAFMLLTIVASLAG